MGKRSRSKMSWDQRKEAALVSEVRAARGVPEWQEVAANFNLKFAPEKFSWDQLRDKWAARETKSHMTQISRHELATYETDFAKFDTNRNGSIDKNEVQQLAAFQLGLPGLALGASSLRLQSLSPPLQLHTCCAQFVC